MFTVIKEWYIDSVARGVVLFSYLWVSFHSIEKGALKNYSFMHNPKN